MEQRVCTGSIKLIFGNGTRTLNPTDSTIVNLENPIMISRAENQGCGCFEIYTRRNGRGYAYPLPENGNIIADIVVRSFMRVEC